MLRHARFFLKMKDKSIKILPVLTAQSPPSSLSLSLSPFLGVSVCKHMRNQCPSYLKYLKRTLDSNHESQFSGEWLKILSGLPHCNCT